MMDTPAPSSPPPVEPELPDVEAPATYPAPPQNVGSPPFSILVALFEKLQTERRQERRKRLIDSWFNVRGLLLLPDNWLMVCSIGEKRRDIIYILSYV